MSRAKQNFRNNYSKQRSRCLQEAKLEEYLESTKKNTEEKMYQP